MKCLRIGICTVLIALHFQNTEAAIRFLERRKPEDSQAQIDAMVDAELEDRGDPVNVTAPAPKALGKQVDPPSVPVVKTEEADSQAKTEVVSPKKVKEYREPLTRFFAPDAVPQKQMETTGSTDENENDEVDPAEDGAKGAIAEKAKVMVKDTATASNTASGQAFVSAKAQDGKTAEGADQSLARSASEEAEEGSDAALAKSLKSNGVSQVSEEGSDAALSKTVGSALAAEESKSRNQEESNAAEAKTKSEGTSVVATDAKTQSGVKSDVVEEGSDAAEEASAEKASAESASAADEQATTQDQDRGADTAMETAEDAESAETDNDLSDQSSDRDDIDQGFAEESVQTEADEQSDEVLGGGFDQTAEENEKAWEHEQKNQKELEKDQDTRSSHSDEAAFLQTPPELEEGADLTIPEVPSQQDADHSSEVGEVADTPTEDHLAESPPVQHQAEEYDLADDNTPTVYLSEGSGTNDASSDSGYQDYGYDDNGVQYDDDNEIYDSYDEVETAAYDPEYVEVPVETAGDFDDDAEYHDYNTDYSDLGHFEEDPGL